MPRYIQIIAQIICTIAQVWLAAGVIPEPHSTFLHLSVSSIQAVMGIIAHSFNPDGTKAVEPYGK